MTTELLSGAERQDKIKKLLTNLSEKFDRMLWNHPGDLESIKRLRPSFIEEFWERWDELGVRCSEYLEGKIEWGGDAFQLEFTPVHKVPYPRLVIDRDVENYARDLFVWFVTQTKDL